AACSRFARCVSASIRYVSRSRRVILRVPSSTPRHDDDRCMWWAGIRTCVGSAALMACVKFWKLVDVCVPMYRFDPHIVFRVATMYTDFVGPEYITGVPSPIERVNTARK